VNEILKVIDQRRSTRTYAETPITEQEKALILNAAYRAPTAGNMMLYSIIDVTDPIIKERLVETCDDQPFIAKAPLVLVFLADYQRWWDYYNLCRAQDRASELGVTNRKPQAGDLLLACCDALIAAQNTVIAAESLGIGSCYIGDVMENYEIHQELFNLPQYVFPIGMLCYGRPVQTETQRHRVPRYDPEFMTFENRYQRLDDAALTRMYASNNERLFAQGQPVQGALNFGQHNYLRKFTAEFSFEMSRSVEKMLENWQ
jgi:FMN reductase (NADPH)/FMN reductase [NAD(P)H]